ncbi:MAG TPA: DEAD/DEAH box helicase [Acidimicrobiia bacterium]|nr:DEAD/DEAH box helicase [Acidimicrobiia bacterium]
MSVLDRFTPATRAWFEASFPHPTPAQERGWEAIGEGAHTLIHAPTGSGKTLAAFLWTIDRLLHEPVPSDDARCRVLYVSPLKALAYDIERNLRAPLVGIRQAGERIGGDRLPQLTTFLRTGDTPPEDRRRMQRQPPDILITTPESLYLLLTSQAGEALRSVRWVIVDEVHAVAGTKRGAHLAVSLERLEEMAPGAQRIGLSATQRPLDRIAAFLGGGTFEDGERADRPVAIVDVDQQRDIDLEIIVPVEDMAAPAPPDPLDPDTVRQQSIWPAVHPRLLQLIEENTSTIVFANSRRLAERICAEVNELAGKEIARSHHGSVSREQRVAIEEALKRGDLKAVVATSSLELGIDMGAVDLVIQVEAPISVASGLQRVGRAGHHVGETSRAKLFPKYRGDLLVATVVASEMRRGRVEQTAIPRNPLDVLAQQLVATVVAGDSTADGLYSMVRRAAPYADLPRSAFEATLDMLAGRYPSDLFAELRPRLNWDRLDGSVTARPGARQLAVTNPGTIPDRGLYRVVLPDGSRVGELDEEMVYESRQGDVFVLGASTWRIADIGVDRVEVLPAPGEPAAKVPFWHGDMAGRPLETGRAVGRFVRETGALDPSEARTRLMTDHGLDDWAAANLIAYLEEEREATGMLPDDRTIVVERFRDEIGDWRVVILSPLGARVHAPWAMALTQKLRGRYGTDVDVIWSDDGIALRFPDADELPTVDELTVDPEEIEPLLVDHLADSALFAARFREAAGRSLLLPRRRPGSRTPLWLQRRRAAGLLSVAKEFGSFPIVLETYREILQDDFDVPALTSVLGEIRSRQIRMVEVEVPSPSPFASSLLFAFVAAYLYEADTPLAERRAAALTLDRELLAELLGEGELRQLLSADVIAAMELELQRLTPERAARTADAITDLLRDLGPLSIEEIDLRTEGVDVAATLGELSEKRRVIQVHVGGEPRWAAVEDAARLRDALGVQPPPGVPHVFLEPVEDPLGDVVGRFARTHSPFHLEEAARGLQLAPSVVEGVLHRLESAGRVARGAFSPGRAGSEWVDSEVLRRIKRRSLSELRGEIEPVEEAALGRFLPVWHGVGSGARGRAALLEVIHRLQAAEIPASVLERDILEPRVGEAVPLLDQLMVEGEIVWSGRGSLGSRDGRIALYHRSRIRQLHTPPVVERPEGQIHDVIRGHLSERGASFFADIYTVAGGGDPEEAITAIWDLVWAGEVTNDSLAPVRAFLGRRGRRSARRLPSSFPPHSAGRWSLLAPMVEGDANDTERATAWANQLLDRHGVVTRSTVLSEGFPGGFSALYPVFTRLEETGRVRRGYFVEGQGGAQFASPGAVDRLRNTSGKEVLALAATDPANPYGSVLPWPDSDIRLARVAGAYVFLSDGKLAGYVDKGGRNVAAWDEKAEPSEVAAALADVAARHTRFTLETVNGTPVSSSHLSTHLIEQGFVTATRGLTWRGVRARR